MSDVEAAWVAGLLEGEGSFMVLSRHGGSVRAPRISCGMSDIDVVERLHATVGAGTLVNVKPREAALGSKPMLAWSINRMSEVRDLALRIRPFMGERRQAQIDDVLASIGDIEPREEGVCLKGHRIEGANRANNGGKGTCRTCLNERQRQQYAAKRQSSQTL